MKQGKNERQTGQWVVTTAPIRKVQVADINDVNFTGRYGTALTVTRDDFLKSGPTRGNAPRCLAVPQQKGLLFDERRRTSE
jgi:hypothetical protein